MSYKNHTIFGEKKENNDINKVFINKDQKGNWYFQNDKGKYILAPATLTEFSLSPLVAGADKAIQFGCKSKNLDSKDGLYLYFSEEQFLDCDIRLELKNNFFDGWIYDAFSENIKTEAGQKIWACNYLNIYYDNPPKIIYLKLDVN
jgi:hypothetical protein